MALSCIGRVQNYLKIEGKLNVEGKLNAERSKNITYITINHKGARIVKDGNDNHGLPTKNLNNLG